MCKQTRVCFRVSKFRELARRWNRWVKVCQAHFFSDRPLLIVMSSLKSFGDNQTTLCSHLIIFLITANKWLTTFDCSRKRICYTVPLQCSRERGSSVKWITYPVRIELSLLKYDKFTKVRFLPLFCLYWYTIIR